MSLGDNIRTARQNMKLTQQELADIMSSEDEKIGNTTISNWENNINKPDADTIATLCNVLKVDANYLLDFNNESKKNNDFEILDQYKILFDKDTKLTDNQKEFILNTIEEQHRKIDEEIEKGNVN